MLEFKYDVQLLIAGENLSVDAINELSNDVKKRLKTNE